MTNSLHSQKTPGLPKKILRGLLRKCAWCGGSGAFFTSWYTKDDHCQTCGLSRERGYEGFELGAATMGVFMTFGSIISWMIISVITGVPLVPLLLVAALLAICVPSLGYPLTYTVWFAIDITFRSPSAGDFAQAQAWLDNRASV